MEVPLLGMDQLLMRPGFMFQVFRFFLMFVSVEAHFTFFGLFIFLNSFTSWHHHLTATTLLLLLYSPATFTASLNVLLSLYLCKCYSSGSGQVGLADLSRLSCLFAAAAAIFFLFFFPSQPTWNPLPLSVHSSTEVKLISTVWDDAIGQAPSSFPSFSCLRP